MLAAVERYTRRRARGLGGILRPEEVRRRIGEAGGGAAAGSGEPIGDAMAQGVTTIDSCASDLCCHDCNSW